MTTLHLPQTILGLVPQRPRPIPREKSIFATITLARDIQAQGPIARQHTMAASPLPKASTA